MQGKTQVAVSFENGRVKVVEATVREGRLAVMGSSVYEDAEFALYLQQTRADDFYVACDFPDLIHEILHVPPAKNRYLRPLVEREVRKRFPEIKDPLVAFHVLREQARDGKKVLEVMVYLVERARLGHIVNIFEKNGKRVSFLCPAILPLARLVHASLESQDEILLTVIDGGTTKTLLVTQDGQILFLRIIQSRDFGIDDIDSDNINMTVTYSRQTLRAEPARCIILGNPGRTDLENNLSKLILPSVHLPLPASVFSVDVPQEDIYSNVALLFFSQDLAWGNLVPPEHTAFFRKKTILKYGAALFFFFSLVLSGYSLKTLAEVPGLKAQMTNIRADMSRRQSVWSEWVKARDELKAYAPLISFSNTVGSSPNVFLTLRTFSFLPMEHVRISQLHFVDTPEGTKVEIKGQLMVDKYGEMSMVYQGFLKELKTTGKVEVRSHSLEVRNRSFSVEGLVKQERMAPGE